MTTIQTRLIVLLSDGTRLKGFARDFNPARPNFHLMVAGPQGETGEGRQIAMSDVDAVFLDRKSTRLNSSHLVISYAVFCWKKKIKLGVLHSICMMSALIFV